MEAGLRAMWRWYHPCSGQENSDVEPPLVALVMDGFLKEWHGTLPVGWFTFKGAVGLQNITKLIVSREFLIVGSQATVFWLNRPQLCNKRKLFNLITQVRNVVELIQPGSCVFFVTHVPMKGRLRAPTINYNKNLLYIVRKLKCQKPAVATKSVALHHWCLKQGKEWDNTNAMSQFELSMMFLIVLEVDTVRNAWRCE